MTNIFKEEKIYSKTEKNCAELVTIIFFLFSFSLSNNLYEFLSPIFVHINNGSNTLEKFKGENFG